MGFGAQGRAQALNLRDSGLDVGILLRPESPRLPSAKALGFEPMTDPAEAARQAQTAAILLPDSEQPRFYKEVLEPNLPEGAAVAFAHGFCVHYGRIKPRPDLDVIMAAPLAHGDLMRSEYEAGGSVPCVIAVAQDATGRARQRLGDYARAICRRGPFIESTFAEEVETDLFAEQAVLCGGVPELVRAAFDTLVQAGYDERIAYVSCLRELRAIVDLMLEGAIDGMRSRISDTARYGAITRGPRIIGENVRAELKRVLDEIRSGEFAEEMGGARHEEAGGEAHPIDRVHRGFASNRTGQTTKGAR